MEECVSVDSKVLERINELWRMVGNTPLIAIDFTFSGKKRVIYAKSEQLNLTGSIKDRMALHILEKAYKLGKIKPGDTIVEATSGNTGISFSAIGRALGHPVTIFMPDWMSRERVDLIQSMGANIIPVTREQGGFLGSIQKAEELSRREKRIFLPCQFSNLANGRFLKANNSFAKIHPIEPAESPTLSTGRKVGHHRIQGISDEFIPAIVDLENLDKIVAVSDGDAILLAQKLASKLGFAVGISSGANFLGALKVQNESDEGPVTVTVFPDDNKKYLSTDLLREEPIKSHYLTPEVEFLGFRVIKRVCHACCDMYNCVQRQKVNTPCH
ncbi:PLP-dependent cysteine synthase family protein [bacterium]|nr:PLP-dependent cysteine synthase family protein [bacterium]